MSVHISLVGVVFALTVLAIAGLALLKLLAALGNAMLGRSRCQSNGSSGFGIMASAATGIAVVGVVTLMGVRLFESERSSITVTASPAVAREVAAEVRGAAFEVTRDLREAYRDVEQAREDMRQTVRGLGQVHVESGDHDDTVQVALATDKPSKSVQTPNEALTAERPDDTTRDGGQSADNDVQNGEASETQDAASASSGTERAEETAAGEAAEDPAPESPPTEAQGVSESGNVVVFQLTEESLDRLMGAGGREWLQEFQDRIPEEFRESYALIPLSATVGTTAPAAARPFAAADRIQAVLKTIASMLPEAASSAKSSDVVTTAGMAAQAAVANSQNAEAPLTVAPTKAPEWLQVHDTNQRIVESQFVPGDEDGATELRQAVHEALGQHVRDMLETQGNESPRWEQLVSLQLSDSAFQDCVVDTWERYEVIETNDGPKTMRKTIALVAFPDRVEREAIAEVQKARQNHRTGVLAGSVGLIWVGLVAAAIGVRIGRRKSRFGRLLVAPVFLLGSLALSGLGVALVAATSAGEHIDSPFDDVRYTHIIDGSAH